MVKSGKDLGKPAGSWQGSHSSCWEFGFPRKLDHLFSLLCLHLMGEEKESEKRGQVPKVLRGARGASPTIL